MKPFAPPRPAAHFLSIRQSRCSSFDRPACPERSQVCSPHTIPTANRPAWEGANRADVHDGQGRKPGHMGLHGRRVPLTDRLVPSMGATCTHRWYVCGMAKVLHIRDVPDDVHDALVEAAEAQGLSLTRYMLHELEHLAKRRQVVQDNAAVIRRTQAKVQGRPDRDTILSVLHEGRGD